MDLTLGTLAIVPVRSRLDLLGTSVADALKKHPQVDEIGVAEIDPELSDTAAFCAQYQIGLEEAANCVIVEARRAEKNYFAACVILGSTRTDVNGLVRKTLDVRKVSFAKMEEAVAQTGMEFGAITPIGLPEGWSILVDRAVTEAEHVVIGSGVRRSKLVVPGGIFASLPDARILSGLGVPKLL